jgi:hypothetical protein
VVRALFSEQLSAISLQLSAGALILLTAEELTTDG